MCRAWFNAARERLVLENLILFPNSLKSNHSASQTPPYRFPYYWPFTSGHPHLVEEPKNHTHTLYWYIVHENARCMS